MNGVDPAASLALDPRAVRRGFERSATGFDAAARIQREVCSRLVEHLQPIRIRPRRILDLGAGTGDLGLRLAREYRGAELVALDLCTPLLARCRAKAPRWFSRHRLVCADALRLPLKASSVDMVCSNLLLPWIEDPVALFREAKRALRHQGLVMLSTLGPDTLRELREAWSRADAAVHVHGFLDMHDVGDAMVRAGLADVVVDAERLTVLYPDVDTLARDLRQQGAGNAALGRPRGLTGRQRWSAMREAYEQWRRNDTLPATFEIVYAHAWCLDRSPIEVSMSSLQDRPG